MDKIDLIQVVMMLAAVVYAGKARTSQAISVLVSTVGLCAFITGFGLVLPRERVTWTDLLHGNVSSETILDLTISGAMYAGMIFFLGLYVCRALAKADAQETAPSTAHD